MCANARLITRYSVQAADNDAALVQVAGQVVEVGTMRAPGDWAKSRGRSGCTGL